MGVELVATAEKQLQFVRINLNQIIPDVVLPFGIFLFFKGQYVEAIKKNNSVPISFLAKSLLEENYFAYIAAEDHGNWLEWSMQKRRSSSLESFTELDENLEAAGRRAKYLQYATLGVHYKSESLRQKELVNKASGLLRSRIQGPLLIPFFAHHVEEPVLKHSARVTYLMILFILAHPDLMKIDDAQSLIDSAIIHELKGDPEAGYNLNTNQETLEFIEKNKWVFPEAIIKLIQSHDKDSIALSIFSVINQFDHTYLTSSQSPSRKIKLEKTIELLTSNAQNFEPTVLEYFLSYIQQLDYIV